MRRVNGWQRIGVVASVGWLLYVATWVGLDYLFEGRAPAPFVESVQSVPPASGSLHPGQRLTIEEFAGVVEHNFRIDRLLLVLFVPVALLWAISYAVVFIVSWVVAGFKKQE